MKLYSLSDLCRKAGVPMYSAANIEKMYGVKPRSRSGRSLFYSAKDVRTVRLAARPKATRLHPARATPLPGEELTAELIAAITDLRVGVDRLTSVLTREQLHAAEQPPAA